jgi:hypothetical protein
MVQILPNKLYQRQNKRLIPDVLRKAVISRVNIAQRQADIYFINNPETIMQNVPFSNSVDLTTLVPGSKVVVDLFSEVNPKDIVIAYAYGGAPSSAGVVGESVVITYVSNVVLNNLGGGNYTLTKTTKTMTFVNGILTTST